VEKKKLSEYALAQPYKTKHEIWVDSQFIHFLNDYTNIMTYYFTKNFSNLSNPRFTFHKIPEFGFDQNSVVYALLLL